VEKTIFSPEHRSLVELLRTLRENAGLSQLEVAERLDRPQSFVSKYESGQRRLDLIELRSVCAALGTDLVAFVRLFEKRIH
jgi:transcriptional regulator with XRE-family HTH domain